LVAGECVGIPSIVEDIVLLSISVFVDCEEYNVDGYLIEGGVLVKEYTTDGRSPAMMNNDATTTNA